MITVVPQSSILGPLLFNIFLNIFLFISKCQLCNYAHDSTLYKSEKNMRKIKNNLKMGWGKWFYENSILKMVLWKSRGTKPGKCHYIAISDDDPSQKIILNDNEIACFNEGKLLGTLLESKLNFECHITSLYKKAGQKISAFARINHYLTPDSKIPIQLLPTDLDVYFSIFKQCIKQHSRKSLTFDL